MTVIVDSSFLVALYDDSDRQHRRANNFTFDGSERLLVPDVVLPEVSHVLRRRFYYQSSFAFFEFFDFEIASLEPVRKVDLTRIEEIAQQYQSAEFDLVDCCIMAIAERLGITRIATFDGRDFSIYRPRHCDYFELLP